MHVISDSTSETSQDDLKSTDDEHQKRTENLDLFEKDILGETPCSPVPPCVPCVPCVPCALLRAVLWLPLQLPLLLVPTGTDGQLC